MSRIKNFIIFWREFLKENPPFIILILADLDLIIYDVKLIIEHCHGHS